MARPLHRSRSITDNTASLILRISLMVTLAILSVSVDATSTALSVTAAILGCLIGWGFLARVAAAASVALIAVIEHGDPAALLPIAAEGVALMLIGAGAYSVDGFIFHKRLSQWGDRL